MDVNRIAAIVLRQYYLMRGNLSRVLSPVVWVTIDILLWGFITKYLNTVTSAGFNFVPVGNVAPAAAVEVRLSRYTSRPRWLRMRVTSATIWPIT